MTVVVLGLVFLVLVAVVAATTRRFDHVVSPVTLFGLGLFLYVVAIPVEVSLTGKPSSSCAARSTSRRRSYTHDPPGLVALSTFVAGYYLVVDRTPFDRPTFRRADVVHAQRSLVLCAGLAVVGMLVLFGPSCATRDYTTSYTDAMPALSTPSDSP